MYITFHLYIYIYIDKFRLCISENVIYVKWRPFAHIAIDHQPLTALEQWKASKLLWVAVVSRKVGKRDAPYMWHKSITI